MISLLPKRSSWDFSVGPLISASKVSFLADSLFSACRKVPGRTPKAVGAKASEAGATTAKEKAAAANFMVEAVKREDQDVTSGRSRKKRTFSFNIRVSDISHIFSPDDVSASPQEKNRQPKMTRKLHVHTV
jgi:hypothetical protein